MKPADKTPLIILTGPKHSGKSSTAEAYAKEFTCICSDLDTMISEKTGSNPRTLFEQGIDVFRAAEYSCLKELLETAYGDGKEYIVAAGGGLIDNEKAWTLLKDRCIVVYLEISAECAWKRIQIRAKREGSLPPFLRTENPFKTQKLIHERRGKAYKNEAHIIIKAEHKTPQEIALIIREQLEKLEYTGNSS